VSEQNLWVPGSWCVRCLTWARPGDLQLRGSGSGRSRRFLQALAVSNTLWPITGFYPPSRSRKRPLSFLLLLEVEFALLDLVLTRRNHQPLLPPSASAWIRRTLAESIRSRSPYAVNLLLGGYDITTSIPHLYWIDYLGTKAIVPYAAHGLGVYVSLSTMDKWWYDGIGREEGVNVLKKCVDEVEKRK
jgi:hypothetical protein